MSQFFKSAGHVVIPGRLSLTDVASHGNPLALSTANGMTTGWSYMSQFFKSAGHVVSPGRLPLTDVGSHDNPLALSTGKG